MAFLPMNVPYTMTQGMVAEAVSRHFERAPPLTLNIPPVPPPVKPFFGQPAGQLGPTLLSDAESPVPNVEPPPHAASALGGQGTS